MKSDEYWMAKAIAEAEKGVGLTSPNPPVGAVIVKNNRLLGKGWHKRAGKPHAEREAIADAAKKHGIESLRKATIYVTLEPCSTSGRTPACTDGICEVSFSTVVYGARDPNPEHAGRADKILKEKGINVVRLPDQVSCDNLIRPFAKVQRTGLPWVILKSAMSLDGRITRPPSEGQWLTSTESRQIVQRLRFESDAILTGGNTLRIDNPALTIRNSTFPKKPQPWRMIVTRGQKDGLPQNRQLFTDHDSEKTIVQEGGDIRAALKSLVRKGCNTVLVEAGGTLMSAFLDQNLADEVAIFYAPIVTGGVDKAFNAISENISLTNQSYQRIGGDVLLRAQIKK
ncbi:MAG: bifunctional diaminohydroxyphosphoribosylaminopyrimidine deaminase/5-amino-6-(5-phosphoribosylamino)uracil reductase RibD [Akkermansiaceae bacterium]